MSKKSSGCISIQDSYQEAARCLFATTEVEIMRSLVWERGFIVDYMMKCHDEITAKESFDEEEDSHTIHLAVYLFDRTLHRYCEQSVEVVLESHEPLHNHLFKLAYACLRLAMKHEDVMQLSAELFIEHSFLNIRWQPRIDKDDLADIECDIVTIIDCTYVVHTVDAFLRRWLYSSGATARARHFAEYLSELTMTSLELSAMNPRHLAAAVLYITWCTLGADKLRNNALESATQVLNVELITAVDSVRSYYASILDALFPARSIQSLYVYQKYCESYYDSVASYRIHFSHSGVA